MSWTWPPCSRYVMGNIYVLDLATMQQVWGGGECWWPLIFARTLMLASFLWPRQMYNKCASTNV